MMRSSHISLCIGTCRFSLRVSGTFDYWMPPKTVLTLAPLVPFALWFDVYPGTVQHRDGGHLKVVENDPLAYNETPSLYTTYDGTSGVVKTTRWATQVKHEQRST